MLFNTEIVKTDQIKYSGEVKSNGTVRKNGLNTAGVLNNDKEIKSCSTMFI